MGFGSIGGYNPNLNAYGAGKVKKPAEGEQQGETKAPELNMADTSGSETNTNVTLSGLDALATYGQANIGKPVVPTGEADGTDAPVVTQDSKDKHWGVVENQWKWSEKPDVQNGDRCEVRKVNDDGTVSHCTYEKIDGVPVLVSVLVTYQ